MDAGLIESVRRLDGITLLILAASRARSRGRTPKSIPPSTDDVIDHYTIEYGGLSIQLVGSDTPETNVRLRMHAMRVLDYLSRSKTSARNQSLSSDSNQYFIFEPFEDSQLHNLLSNLVEPKFVQQVEHHQLSILAVRPVYFISITGISCRDRLK